MDTLSTEARRLLPRVQEHLGSISSVEAGDRSGWQTGRWAAGGRVRPLRSPAYFIAWGAAKGAKAPPPPLRTARPCTRPGLACAPARVREHSPPARLGPPSATHRPGAESPELALVRVHHGAAPWASARRYTVSLLPFCSAALFRFPRDDRPFAPLCVPGTRVRVLCLLQAHLQRCCPQLCLRLSPYSTPTS